MTPSFDEFCFQQYMLVNGMHDPHSLPAGDLAKWQAKFAAVKVAPELLELLREKYDGLYPQPASPAAGSDAKKP